LLTASEKLDGLGNEASMEDLSLFIYSFQNSLL